MEYAFPGSSCTSAAPKPGANSAIARARQARPYATPSPGLRTPAGRLHAAESPSLSRMAGGADPVRRLDRLPGSRRRAGGARRGRLGIALHRGLSPGALNHRYLRLARAAAGIQATSVRRHGMDALDIG